jgi:peptidase E
MSARKPQIIAMGGGTFTVEPDNPRLERYVLSQCGARNPRICFLGTATGDADTYIAKFYAAFSRLRCRPTHVPLFARTPDLEKILLSQDIIYVGGGNTKSMLAVWRDWEIPALLAKAWRRGIILTGVSAGAICWFEAGVTDSWAGRLAALKALGFLPGACCPHYDGEAERRPALHRLVAARELPRALALDDGAAAHFVGRKLLRIVVSRPKAGGYDVRRRGESALETPLPVRRLSRGGLIGPGTQAGRKRPPIFERGAGRVEVRR